MAKITVEEINNVLSTDGWQLISETYKNLNTNLEYKCKEGHTVIAPWKQIRQLRVCPICMKNSLKTKEFKNTKKKAGEFRILALDQATHVSGYALFGNKNLLDYGTFNAVGSNEIERDVRVREWLENLIRVYDVDFVGLEGIQYDKERGIEVYATLARLQGILMELCYELKIPYKVVPTNTWRNHCGVKGQSRPDKKRSMQLIVKKWYEKTASEDECDAIGIGKYFSDLQAPKVEIVDWENM